ncbi:hypothetical protein HGH93_05440 [Chitinophaga polysaccharea]|uniref:hypothetical protein n=1 Tax=Chitinophaga TaxID=79328 RepID=UPI00145580AA|nr:MULTISPECIES: hypothetical protein [Chitinophaga]NLR57530.1 hypothetical protein [Chitinophaga polysaccharea]NLU95444.1 hypothetical protein [Chitinophaga sp. Ak27]
MNEKMQPTAPQQAFNDAQCAVTNTPIGDIPYATTPTSENLSDAENAIANLTFPLIWELPPYRTSLGTIFLEVFAVTNDGGRNWKIINGLTGNSSIADIEMSGNLATASTSERRQHVLQMVQSALTESLQTGKQVAVNGPCK